MPPRVIINPAAGQGASGKAWPDIEAGLRSALGNIDINVTAHSGDETNLARKGIAEGAEHFIAVGGDGTMNGVLNGIMGDDITENDQVRLSVIPVGTANESTNAMGALVDRICLAGDRFEPVDFTGHLPAGPVKLS